MLVFKNVRQSTSLLNKKFEIKKFFKMLNKNEWYPCGSGFYELRRIALNRITYVTFINCNAVCGKLGITSTRIYQIFQSKSASRILYPCNFFVFTQKVTKIKVHRIQLYTHD